MIFTFSNKKKKISHHTRVAGNVEALTHVDGQCTTILFTNLWLSLLHEHMS